MARLVTFTKGFSELSSTSDELTKLAKDMEVTPTAVQAEEWASSDEETSRPVSPAHKHKLGLTRKKIKCPIHQRLEAKNYQVLNRYTCNKGLLVHCLTPLGDQCFIRAERKMKTHHDQELEARSDDTQISQSTRNGVLQNLPATASGAVIIDGGLMEVHQRQDEENMNRFDQFRAAVRSEGHIEASYPLFDISAVPLKSKHPSEWGDCVATRDTAAYHGALDEQNTYVAQGVLTDLRNSIAVLSSAADEYEKVIDDMRQTIADNVYEEHESLQETLDTLQGLDPDRADGLFGASKELPPVVEEKRAKDAELLYSRIKSAATTKTKLVTIESTIKETWEMTTEINGIAGKLKDMTSQIGMIG